MKNYNYPWTSREETLRRILERSQFEPRIEMIPVNEALNRITAQDALSVNTLPNAPTSMLDGIALRSSNLDGGIPETENWQLGVDYVFSNTGVGIPEEFDTVVLIEDVNFDENGKLTISCIPEKGKNIRPVGDMMKTGDVLVLAYVHLRPAHLGLLTAGGVDKIAVLEKPKVAILPTGNELVTAGTQPPRGKNVEYNGMMIKAQVESMGAEAKLYPITRDNPEDLIKVIENALAWADIVILNGGSSKGSDDRAIEVLESIGEVLVYEVAYGPGKHTTMTIAGHKPIVGTVGPTIGAEYAVDWYVEPLINKYLHQPTVEPQHLKVKLLEEIKAPMPFDFYARMEVRPIKGGFAAKQIGKSAPLAQQMMANAILHIPGEVHAYKAGEMIEVELKCPIEWIERKMNYEF